MTSEQWQKIKVVLEKAMEIAPERRPAFLQETCGADTELRREVEDLLEFEEADALEQTAFSIVTENGAGEIIGKQIGRYKITGELGAGGMGAVYLAERADGEFEQKAAVKLIKNGINSDLVLRRFLNERRILAALEHPNIAHLIDGGTTPDGLPFFVMEYVEGVPINEYADRRGLNLEQRLDLFREVCAAVSFAHRKLIIHRDLKPSNVLVTGDGQVKLLDFGIAKLTRNDSGGETRTQTVAFTPEYASPEQLRGERLSTATDIYSLGVILYELLTGTRPFRFENKNLGEIIRTASQTEPAAPSAVSDFKFEVSNSDNRKSNIANRKSLRGDLDNIILKALKKEPERRYSSVEQFSEDIRRHLAGLPVTARRDTWAYRAEKFTRRNPLVVGAIALAFLILIGGISATLYQARKANAERAKAERRFNDVRALANSFMFEINEEISKSPIKARELLVHRAIEYLDKLAAESDGNAELESELAAAYEKIGSVQAELFNPALGKTSDALESHQKSLEIRERLFAAEPTNIQRGLEAATSRMLVGDILSMSGRVAQARENYAQAVEFCRRLLRLDGANLSVRHKLAQSYARHGQSILRSGALGDALRSYEESLKIYRELSLENPSDAQFQLSLSIIYSYIGYVKIETGEFSEAVDYFGDALALNEKFLPGQSENIKSKADLSIAHLWFGVALSEQGEHSRAHLHLEKALKLQTAVFETDRQNFGNLNALADCYLELGREMLRAGNSDAAVKNLNKAIESYDAVWEADRQNFSARRQIAYSQLWLGDAFRQKRDAAKAGETYRKSLHTIEDLTKKDANNTEWQNDFAVLHLKLGEINMEKGNRAAALQNLETARPILEKLSADSPENVKRNRDLETVQKYLAELKN